MAKIQILLLAAGASKRMEEPKQLLPWGTVSLIEHQINTLLKTKYPVSVVLGAYSDKISPLLKNLPVSTYTNETWKKGMGDSISFGIKQLLNANPTTEAVLISLIDQPLLITKHFNKILNMYQSGTEQIIASRAHNGWYGAPVLFDTKYFEELQNLIGDEGAKIITNKHQHLVVYIDGGTLLRDIDTPEVYRELLEECKP